jgi:hypothetical protein
MTVDQLRNGLGKFPGHWAVKIKVHLYDREPGDDTVPILVELCNPHYAGHSEGTTEVYLGVVIVADGLTAKEGGGG